jgi:tetratricopeptide (TPR) repeat protein
MIVRKYIAALIYVLFLNAFFVAQDKKLEELLVGKDFIRSYRLIDSMGKLGVSKDPATAVYYHNTRIELCKQFNNDTALGLAMWKKGVYLRRRGDLDDAEKSLREAKNIYKKANDPDGEITVLMGLGNLYNQKGVLDAALNVFFEAIAIAEKHKRPDALGAIYVNIVSFLYQSKGICFLTV